MNNKLTMFKTTVSTLDKNWSKGLNHIRFNLLTSIPLFN